MSRRTEMYSTTSGGNETNDVVVLTRDDGFQGFEEITCKQGTCLTLYLTFRSQLTSPYWLVGTFVCIPSRRTFC